LQIGTLEAYIIEFQRMEVTMIDISKRRLVMLFTKGFTKSLKGWLKDFSPITLHDYIIRNQDIDGIVPKKTIVKPFIP
jgi:hypothetical protein